MVNLHKTKERPIGIIWSQFGSRIKDSKEYKEVKGIIILSINGCKVPHIQVLNEIMSRKKANSPTPIELKNLKACLRKKTNCL